MQAGPEFLAQLSQLQHGLMSVQRCEHCQLTFPDPIQNSLHVSTITFFSLKRIYINFSTSTKRICQDLKQKSQKQRVHEVI